MNDRKDVILVVDDERVNVKVLVSLLKPQYTTLVALNGQQALERAFGEEKPDLILLDIILPDIDGFEVCRRLKNEEETKDIPVIFISAKSDVADETKGFDIGAVDYITKPFHPSIVTARVRTQMRLKRKTDLLERICALDGLLEIPNRRRFQEVLDNEWARSQREEEPISLILVDLDNFKQYNDHYGHAKGDECLKKVTREMAKHCKRPTDLIARYGGEEFAIILPGTPHKAAMEIAEGMRAGVKALCIDHIAGSNCSQVTISLGVATRTPSAEEYSIELVQAADSMLYQAKEAGRNCVKG